jgi:YHS domain-containing protein
MLEETLLARDPVCGAEVEETQAAAATVYQEKDYFFCSEECKKKFDRNPELFAPEKRL